MQLAVDKRRTIFVISEILSHTLLIARKRFFTSKILSHKHGKELAFHTSLCIVNENNDKNNAIAMELCAVFVVSWWQNKGLHTLNRMHNVVWGCMEIYPKKP